MFHKVKVEVIELKTLAQFNSVLGFFRLMGADVVIEMSQAEDLALMECQKEFVNRFRKKQAGEPEKPLPMLSSSCPGKSYIMFFLGTKAKTNSCMDINNYHVL